MDIEKLYTAFLASRKISTDTRKIEPDSIFFALKGPNFDANAFADEALKKGASLAVIDNPKYEKPGKTFLVPDVLEALQGLARHHRSTLKIPVIGLTGSNGKTTSKELLNAVLSKRFKTLATKGNQNNHIGVPLTILSIDESVEIAIIEMGANHVGEIALLSSIANPTNGFITNIGKAHIGTFGGFENIIRGKSELYQHLLSHNGVVFINSQNDILYNMAKRFKSPVLYPAQGDYLHVELLPSNPFLTYRSESGEIIQTQLTGAYNFENVAAALCIGKFFGVAESDANTAVADYTPANMRSQVVKKGTNTIILDAYNANPSSMEAAIKNLQVMNAKNKIVIVGDMYELEEEAEDEHRAIGKLLSQGNFSVVFLCGELMKWASEEFPQAKYFSQKQNLTDYLKQNSPQNSHILIKASRGMGLETLVDSL
jgi:UDP-N-acetylmuramoyl-tripeptide--D-alanyl-D-alanine ligase